ncbi:hypothetical protein [Rhizobium leguminosarum]|uniref:hypothetical protein n=1 Tax=Rhizobium leguminosarum TaxID=384 RepID=UPI001C96BF60|nr:hypothetical protein [Rhizobium leguminosarum]MBY5318571.1 hypothetical protein [Rhizobium leguminosarum]
MTAEIIDAKVLERRRGMAENGRIMDESWARFQDRQATFTADMNDQDDDNGEEEIEGDPPRERHVPKRYPATGKRSIVVKWFRSSSSIDAYHSFRLSYPVGMPQPLQEQLVAALLAADWRDRAVDSGVWWYDGSGTYGTEFEKLDEILRGVADVFHVGDAPTGLAGIITLRWNERTQQEYVNCVTNYDELPPIRQEQVRNVIEHFDGFHLGQSITFPQLSSGDIVAALRMGGFHIVQTFSDDEPHYIEISENAPIWIRGMIGEDEWLFQTKGDFWEIRIGDADPALYPKWFLASRSRTWSRRARAWPSPGRPEAR